MFGECQNKTWRPNSPPTLLWSTCGAIYIIISLCCPLYGLEPVPGKHCPVETIAGSITTTMSICSVVTGSSRV